MKTPICDFVSEYVSAAKARLHMPGHKGTSFLGFEKKDITEIDGADVLYSSSGIIRESEDNASALFGTARTLYSTEGSSLSIRAMLFLALIYAKNEGRAPTVLAGRNAHKAFLCAAAMLDIDIVWMYADDARDILGCDIDARKLDGYLSEQKYIPCAVYITSPDYLGNISDIRALSEVCRRWGVLLLVDNAHGAYLNFLDKSMHPISLDADICCDSAHKTLPVLTGGGYLHISRTAPEYLCDMAESAMAMFASTSPSYLILQSLDMANRYISDGYRERLGCFCGKVAELRRRLTDAGYTLIGKEALKLTLDAKKYGYTGIEIAEVLRANAIECEFADPDYTVLMLTPECDDAVLGAVGDALCALPARDEKRDRMPRVSAPCRKLTPRQAMLSPSVEMALGGCVGRVLAQPTVSCPPAIPIVVCGEVIDDSAVRAFEYYGISECRVVEDI